MQPWSPFGAFPTGMNTTNPQNLDEALKQAQEIAQSFWKQHISANSVNVNGLEQASDIAPIIKGFADLAQTYMQDPKKMIQMQLDLYQSSLALWANMAERALGKDTSPIAIPEKGDMRFNSANWQEHMVFDFIKQSYLLLSKWTMDAVMDAQGFSDAEKEKLAFYSRQFLDAMSPSNFPLTNPDVLDETIKTQGKNLIDGLQNLLGDIQKGKISMTDYDKFVIGENLATTPGKVVFRNKMFELIQYSPTTEKVHERPLVITPPWINRFYILDLQPKNSFVKYAVEQGFTVFLISWKNPTADYKDVGFEDYMKDGLLTAVDTAREITGSPDVNAIGYCIGGSLLTATLAALEKKGDKRINSATFFTTLMDFTNAGELKVFIDEDQISSIEKKMEGKGYLDGREMASTFSMLRANDLIWSFVVNNYLLGKQPFPFDILYWNDDPTRMPAAMHSWYLRNLYLQNNLCKKDKLKLLGENIDISQINLPIYMVSAINDHITPWDSCYSPLPSFKSKDKRFVLSKAGHVAGVVNPPTPKGKPVKRAYWAGDADVKDPAAWLKNQTQQPDSWWMDWSKWLAERSGEQVKAPAKAGNTKHKAICAAPGTYVVEK